MPSAIKHSWTDRDSQIHVASVQHKAPESDDHAPQARREEQYRWEYDHSLVSVPVPVLNVGAAVAALDAPMIERDADAVLRRDELAADRETTEEATDGADEKDKTEDVCVDRKAVEGEK